MLRRAAQQINFVNKQYQALRVNAPQDAEEPAIGVGYALGCIEHNDARVTRIDAAQCRFFAY